MRAASEAGDRRARREGWMRRTGWSCMPSTALVIPHVIPTKLANMSHLWRSESTRTAEEPPRSPKMSRGGLMERLCG